MSNMETFEKNEALIYEYVSYSVLRIQIRKFFRHPGSRTVYICMDPDQYKDPSIKICKSG